MANRRKQPTPGAAGPDPSRISFCDVNGLDLRPVVEAADAYLRERATHQQIGSDRTFFHVWERWGLLQAAVDGLHLPNSLSGTPERVNGLGLLREGIRHQQEGIERSPLKFVCYVGGHRQVGLYPRGPSGRQTFRFDRTAADEIECGVRLLRQALATASSPPAGQPNAPQAPAEDYPPADREDEDILRAMAEARTLLTIEKIAQASNVSERTVGKRLRAMLAAGLAVRPNGPKSGAQLTERGRERYRRLGGNVA